MMPGQIVSTVKATSRYLFRPAGGISWLNAFKLPGAAA
jgi:hypothetical protein